MTSSFSRDYVPAADVEIGDQFEIGTALFKVVNTGHAVFDQTKLNHTMLLLQRVHGVDGVDAIAQLIIGMDEMLLVTREENTANSEEPL